MSPSSPPTLPALTPADREQIVQLALRVWRARFRWRTRAAGLEDEDAAQEVVVGVLSRIGGWRPGAGASREWWVARSVDCAVSNMIQRERRAIRVPAGGISSLSLDEGGEREIEGSEEPITRTTLREVIEGMGMEQLVEVGMALRGRQG